MTHCHCSVYTFLVMEEKVRLLNITFRVLDSPTKRCLMKASAQSTLKKSMGEGSFFLKKKSHRGRTFFLEWQSKLLSTWKGHLKPSWFLLHFLASILSSVAFLLKGGLSRCFHEMYISVGLSKLLSASKGNLLGFPFKWKGSLDCLSRKNSFPTVAFLYKEKLPSPVLFVKVDCADAFLRHLSQLDCLKL